MVADLGRVCLLVMDSFGIGASLDAVGFGDQGADTFGHIYQRFRPQLPHLASYGLFHAHAASTGQPLCPLSGQAPQACWGYAVEQSCGKDTPSGHWEMAGLPVDFSWGSYSDGFPTALIEELIHLGQLPGVLGLKHASGTVILDELGEAHIASAKPIIYTSGDSVFQIAAHEQYFGLSRLYQLCDIARRLVDRDHIGRVIARPFVGEKTGEFRRTANRRDYATPPHAPTLLDQLKSAGREVIGIGKTADIFAHQGVTRTIRADGNMALFDATLEAISDAPPGSLVFTNFVDFDSLYGHRRDVAGYAQALSAFDARLPELAARLSGQDTVWLSADHGCDPTFPGSDHTREHVPILGFGPELPATFIGRRDSFADLGQTIAHQLAIPPLSAGVGFESVVIE